MAHVCAQACACLHCYYRHLVVHRSLTLTQPITRHTHSTPRSRPLPPLRKPCFFPFLSFPFLSFPFLPPSLPSSHPFSLCFSFFVGSLIPLILRFPVLPLLAVLAHVSRGCQYEGYSGDWLDGGGETRDLSLGLVLRGHWARHLLIVKICSAFAVACFCFSCLFF